jgi:Ring finger domain
MRLLVFILQAVRASCSESDCPICLNSLSLESPRAWRSWLIAGKKRSVSCGHEFHADCLNEWQSRGGSCCPCCRSLLPKSIMQKVRSLSYSIKETIRGFLNDLPGLTNFLLSVFLRLGLVRINYREEVTRELSLITLAVAGILAVRGACLVVPRDIQNDTQNLGQNRLLYKVTMIASGAAGLTVIASSIMDELHNYAKHLDVHFLTILVILHATWGLFCLSFLRGILAL